MGRYELTFEVDNLEDDLIEAIYDRFDALVAAHAEVTLLTVTAEGPTVVVAGKRLVEKLERDLRVVTRRLVEDLVTREDIANRCATTPAVVGQWLRETRPTSFPASYSRVAGGLWLWGEVNDWLRRAGKTHDSGLDFPDREDHNELNLWLKERRTTHKNSPITAELRYSNGSQTQRTRNEGVFIRPQRPGVVSFLRFGPNVTCA